MVQKKRSKWFLGISRSLTFGTLVFLCCFVVLRLTGVRLYVVLSGSMEPGIGAGSLCVVRTDIPYREIAAGDVVAFGRPSGFPVTHRVLRRTEKGLETKGDANDVSDGITTTEENYIGKTIGAIPYAGYAVEFLRTGPGKACVLVGFGMLIFAEAHRDRRKGGTV